MTHNHLVPGSNPGGPTKQKNMDNDTLIKATLISKSITELETLLRLCNDSECKMYLTIKSTHGGINLSVDLASVLGNYINDKIKEDLEAGLENLKKAFKDL